MGHIDEKSMIAWTKFIDKRHTEKPVKKANTMEENTNLIQDQINSIDPRGE